MLWIKISRSENGSQYKVIHKKRRYDLQFADVSMF